MNGQDLSSFAAFTYKDNADEEVTHTSSDLLDEFNIAHQIGMGLVPPSNEFPAVNGVSYDSKDQVYGRAITAGTNRMPITSFGRGSLYTSLGERINTSIHERAHYGVWGGNEGHPIIYPAVKGIMQRAGFNDRQRYYNGD